MKIALIHALAQAIPPVNTAFRRDWPQARLMNLFDDSLSADLAQTGVLDEAMHRRFESLTAYAVDQCGAQAILFTCSAFGPCIEAVARARPGIPVLKPNEAMIGELARDGRAVGLIATFAPTLTSMPAEFPDGLLSAAVLAEGALQALGSGDVDAHNALIVGEALKLRAMGCQVIALAQFSMASARDACQQATGLPVFTTVDSAVSELKRRQPQSPGRTTAT